MINLLPYKNREVVRDEFFRRFIIVFGFGLIVLFLIQVVFLSAIWFFLDSAVSDAEKGFELVNGSEDFKNLDVLDSEIERINKMLVVISENEKVPVAATYLSLLVKSLPPGIKLDSMFFEGQSGGSGLPSLTIEGMAVKRKELLSFVDVLEKNSVVAEVVSPLSNLLAEDNLNFSLTIKFKGL